MLASLARLFRKPTEEPRWLEVPELRQRLDGKPLPLIVDVRSPQEFDGPLGHIEGARNIPFDMLRTHESEIIGAHRPVVFVCLTDKRSAAAAAQLVRVGLSDATVLHGGMRAWREAGL